ncbi:hypothetical protein FPH17_06295 [Corynebacterium godavarianum]|uniref:Roadblock/LC7 domain-containing protein n=1 Tax=Corynebacterium godavarianum TaxID=2054421 RepID=A0ABY3E423_9CORY|nr:hypothetical protein [Corynebacterium godavarianum]MBL7286540.1 hypothetical protein [Corynebacterium godavarianum]TSJ74363.1 hypothetical protein FPH17_06295 [Corynebacterium godavarianum]
MSQQENLNNFLNAVSEDLSGFIGASVVDINTGMSLVSTSRYPDFDLDIAAAYNSEMVKAKFKTMEALGIQGGLQDMLLTLTDQFHLIKILENDLFIYVAVDSSRTNLALLRTAVNSNVKKFGLA